MMRLSHVWACNERVSSADQMIKHMLHERTRARLPVRLLSAPGVWEPFAGGRLPSPGTVEEASSADAGSGEAGLAAPFGAVRALDAGAFSR